MSQLSKKIYYHDTDCGGVVYYANYLKYFEEARTEFLEEKGFLLKELAARGILFVVRRVEIDYKSPAHYGDALTVTTEISKAKSVSLDFSQQINRQDQMLVKAVTQLVCVNGNFQPQVMPDSLREVLVS